MKTILYTLVACVTYLTLSLNMALAETSLDAKEKQRRSAAQTILKNNSNTVAIHTKGLHCPSCAIGIRKKISRLGFVDRQQLNQGVQLDVRNLLVVVAIKPNQSPDLVELAKAIDKAGYKPHQAYALDAGKLKITPIDPS
ncbi:MAG: heavy metal-associated domain-containing protein [Verrucomicrobiota bacterium]